MAIAQVIWGPLNIHPGRKELECEQAPAHFFYQSTAGNNSGERSRQHESQRWCWKVCLECTIIHSLLVLIHNLLRIIHLDNYWPGNAFWFFYAWPGLPDEMLHTTLLRAIKPTTRLLMFTGRKHNRQQGPVFSLHKLTLTVSCSPAHSLGHSRLQMHISVHSDAHTLRLGRTASGCCCKCVIRGASRQRSIADTHSPLLRSLCCAAHSGLQGQLSLCKT